MARGDTEFCRVEVDFILDNMQFEMLPNTAKYIYLWLWCRAVKDRSETLETHWTYRAIAKKTQTRHNLVDESIQCCIKNGWIKIEDDKRITVCGVRSKHKKLAGWKDKNGDPYGDDMGPIRVGSKRESKRESKKPPSPLEGERVEALEIWNRAHRKKNLPTGVSAMEARGLQEKLDGGGITKEQLEAAVEAMLDDPEFRSKTISTFTKHLDRFLQKKIPENFKAWECPDCKIKKTYRKGGPKEHCFCDGQMTAMLIVG